MNIISPPQEEDQKAQTNPLFQQIKHFLEAFEFPNKYTSSIHNENSLIFSFNIPRLDNKYTDLKILWKFQLVADSCNIKISLSDPHKTLDFSKINHFQNESEITKYFNHLNNPCLFQGKFSTTNSSNVLPTFQTDIYLVDAKNIKILANILNLSEKIQKQFLNILQFSKILQKQNQNPAKNSQKQKQSIRILSILKEAFEKARSKRLKSSKIKMFNKKQKCLRVVLQMFSNGILNTDLEFKIQQRQAYAILEKKKIRIRRIQEETKMKLDKRKYQRILTSFTIISEKKKEQLKVRSGFGKICIAQYIFNTQISTNFTIAELNNEKDLLIEQENQTKRIVSKTYKTASVGFEELENQLRCLIYLRNQAHKNIAHFYKNHSAGDSLTAQKYIYSEYYKQTLLSYLHQKISISEKIKIIQGIANAISFFVENKITHRDLKEANLMIGSDGEIKVIDFGSASGFSTNKNNPSCFNSHISQLRGTDGYCLRFEEVVSNLKSIKDLYDKDAFEKNEFVDIFSLGEIIVHLFNFKREVPTNDAVKESLYYLAAKCKEINPEDRLDHHEVLVFLHQLKTLNYILANP